MSIFKELIDDFPYYIGRKLGLSQHNICVGLSKLVGKCPDMGNYYDCLKNYAESEDRRVVVTELIKYGIADFMGVTIHPDKTATKIEKIARDTNIIILERFLSVIFKSDGNWGIWREALNHFGLSTPYEHVDLDGELKRMYLPCGVKKYINKNCLKYYSADRRLRSLAYNTLKYTENKHEINTGCKIQRYYLTVYYRHLGINLNLEQYKGVCFTKEKNDLWSEQSPYLPRLPPNWYYYYDFYKYIRNIVRSELNLCKIEWGISRTIRFDNHRVICDALDSTSNDYLDGVKNIKDLMYMPDQDDDTQEMCLTLLRGDACESIFNVYMDRCIMKSQDQKLLRAWFEQDHEYVALSISKCYQEDGSFNNKRMDDCIKNRFQNNRCKYKKLKQNLNKLF